ncbi:MAG: B12-binding domain-containing radical SAM protein [Thermoplasmata archaeon]|nr:MAG: B12-binding domain-containing radical SAM protein [Thermoplasmata archaeon]
MTQVVLTMDRTLASEYNGHIFLGFAACSPKLIPSWLYTKIFCPSADEENGVLKYGHCGQRKIEAALLNNGFSENDVVVTHPDHLEKVIDKDTRVLCITTHDPLGLGPASTTFSDLVGREPYTAFYFRKLISNPLIRRHNLKVIVGGSGAWQLTDERIIAKLGIDCVVVGEGEITAVKMIEKALNGEDLPPFVEGEVVPLDQISIIKKPTLSGLIEIARGCGRGCRFCNPTMLNYRCQPLDRIIEEVRINVNAGKGVIFHAEDVLRYASKDFVPNEKAVMNLFREVKKLTPNIGISHFAHASAMAKPNLIEKLSELMNAGSQNYPFMSGQVGIETGSKRLVEKYMKGKVKPFKPEKWPEIVRESHKLLADNRWVPCNTLIIGLPGEKPEDVRDTIELVYDIREYKSLIVPLYFVPIGTLRDKKFFRTKDTIPEHWQLLAACMEHNFKWVDELAYESLKAVGMNGFKSWAIRRILSYMKRKLDPYLKIMREGKNPISAT